MFKKLSLRIRLTILSVLLLSACCLFLTAGLNLSANKMADTIEAIPLTPATLAGEASDLKSPSAAVLPLVPVEISLTARKSYLNNSILYMIFITAFGGCITYILSSIALKPLSSLSGQMKNRTVQNLSEELELPASKDEIYDLTNSFNQMTKKLSDAFAMQKRFSQNAAHELRTPLTVIKTRLDVFHKKTVHSAEEYDHLLGIVEKHTGRLSQLILDLLDFTNMENTDYNEPVFLSKMLHEVLSELALPAREKSISLSCSGAEQTIQGNSSLLHRALYNLVDNAIKYSPENTAVLVSIVSENDSIQICITDSGPGIPEGMEELIFEPFFRVDKSRSRSQGGAGLGLSIVKSILEQHDGQISVSANNGGGSRFTITLPA